MAKDKKKPETKMPADDHATHIEAYRAIAPPETAMSGMSGATVQAHLDAHQSLATVADAVARLETEAKRGDPDAVLKSECMLEIEQRRLSASAIALLEDQRADLEAVQGVALSEAAIVFDTLRRAAIPGETLVQAVERLEALAKRAGDLERERDEARVALGYVRDVAEARGWSEAKSPKTLDVFLADAMAAPSGASADMGRLEALARAVAAPAVGLIVQETAPSLYKVHVVESDAEGVRVWDTEPGKAMPWHAAKVLVDRVVETKLTPEDKR